MVGRLGTASALPAFLPWLNFEHRNRFSALRRIRFHLGAHDVNKRIRNESQAGFSFIEILALLGILSTLLAVVLPISRSVAQIFSVSSDARNISASLSLARMLAASQSTHGRLYADLSANAFHVEVWNKTANCWQTDGDTPNTCTQATSPVTSLAQGVTFGFGPVTQGPTPPTNSIAQAASCNSGPAGTNSGAPIANTACIEFNSRGFAVDQTGALVISQAIYVQGDARTRIYAATVGEAGQPRTYSYSGSGTTWNPY
jgi:Tfp pilus assembly protein FimT